MGASCQITTFQMNYADTVVSCHWKVSDSQLKGALQRNHLSELKANDLRLMYISCSCCSSDQLLFSTARFTLLL